MKRFPSQTELWMSYGVIAGALVGSLLFVFTASVFWLGLIPLGVIVGLQIRQARDRTEHDTSPTTTDEPQPGG